ncbi:MAG: gliding motility lipoprotein GldB [Roseivirga sp.]
MQKTVIILCLCLAVAAVLYTLSPFRAVTRHQPPDVTNITVQLEVQRLEQTLFGLEHKKDIQAFLEKNPLFTTQFLGALARREDLADKLHAMVHDPGMKDLYQEVQRVFGDTAALQRQFVQAFRYLKYYYPDFQPPQVVTFITGMGTDLHVSKDLIVIGLDFFMGEGAKFRPIELPQYLLRTYQPAYILPKTILLLSRYFNDTEEQDATLLADMLYYGKSYYFAQALLPEVEEHLMMGYTPEQLADVRQHEDIVWEHFIEHELLYATNHLTKGHYINDRPFTAEIGPRCPGNVGRWLGWEIVKKYMERYPDVSLPTLMTHADAQALFTKAKYRPSTPRR